MGAYRCSTLDFGSLSVCASKTVQRQIFSWYRYEVVFFFHHMWNKNTFFQKKLFVFLFRFDKKKRFWCKVALSLGSTSEYCSWSAQNKYRIHILQINPDP